MTTRHMLMKLKFGAFFLILAASTFANAQTERVSVTGAVFIRDTSVPALGEAYRDSNGVIWGDVVMLQGHVDVMYKHEAKAYCEAGGARLPDHTEIRSLAIELGYGTASGYSPFQGQDPTQEVLPHLNGLTILSLVAGMDSDSSSMNGTTGFIEYITDPDVHGSVRCVSGGSQNKTPLPTPHQLSPEEQQYRNYVCAVNGICI